LTAPKGWKNVSTKWSTKNGTGSVSLSSTKKKTVKVKGTKAGSATVKVKVSYRKNGKVQKSKTYSCSITVIDDTPAALTAVYLVGYNTIDLKFSEDLLESSLDTITDVASLLSNFEIVSGDKKMTTDDFSDVSVSFREGTKNIIVVKLTPTATTNWDDLKNTTYVSVLNTNTLKGADNLPVAATGVITETKMK
jgi:hypothetical protein